MKILVIEDQHIATAKAALVSGEHEFVFAETYEEALCLLEAGVDGVVTDMFFPSQTDWVKHWGRELARSEGWAVASDEEKSRTAMITRLTENPSGLTVAAECMKRAVPFVIVTDENRHYGNLGKIRVALSLIPPFAGEYDPLPKMILGEGIEEQDLPKDSPETWMKAFQELLLRAQS